MKKLNPATVILFLLLGYSLFSQNKTDSLVLKVQNEKIYYQYRNFSTPYDKNTPVNYDNVIHIKLINVSETPYLFVIDTTTLKIHNHIKEINEEYNIYRDSSQVSEPSEYMFRPWLKVYTSDYIPENTGWFLYARIWVRMG